MRRSEKMLAAAVAVSAMAAYAMTTRAVMSQDSIGPLCPNPGEACKVLILTPGEEQILTQPNGILDTAAKARSLDLGALTTYFSQKIATAPAGKIRPVEPEKKPEVDAKGPAPTTPAKK